MVNKAYLGIAALVVLLDVVLAIWYCCGIGTPSDIAFPLMFIAPIGFLVNLSASLISYMLTAKKLSVVLLANVFVAPLVFWGVVLLYF